MIIWLASYPKSGNTWVRAFLSSYLHSESSEFDLNLINKIGEFPDHTILGKFMDNKDFHNLREVSKYWIKVQEFINLKKKITFLKTHSALCHINGNFFTNSDNTLAFIYIVRDPRNVVTSLSNYLGFKYCISVSSGTSSMFLISQLLRWSKGDIIAMPPITFLSTASIIEATVLSIFATIPLATP